MHQKKKKFWHSDYSLGFDNETMFGKWCSLGSWDHLYGNLPYYSLGNIYVPAFGRYLVTRWWYMSGTWVVHRWHIGSISAPAFRWYLKLKCNSCGEVPDHWQYISQEERVPVKVNLPKPDQEFLVHRYSWKTVQGGRGDANAVIKCKLCSRENSIDILPETIARWI